MQLEALYKLSYGMYVVSSVKGKKFNGQIANTVFQMTPNPVTVAACINKKNLTHEFIEASGVFSVSVLERDTPMSFIGRFGFRSGRDFDKFDGINYEVGKTGSPVVIDNAVAFLEAEVVDKVDVGTHTLFVGRVVDAGILSDKEVMTYAYYHFVKRGKTPETASVFVEKVNKL